MIDVIRLKDILEKAEDLSGLCIEDVTYLLTAFNEEVRERVYDLASKIKNKIYGKRIVLFAPLYISNFCQNVCLYCGFHKSNVEITRKRLDHDILKKEVEILINQGVKRVLLVASEDPDLSIDRICEFINSIYSLKNHNGSIRRVNVNIAPLSIEEFKKLKSAKIGTYQVFQETYNIEKYKKYHLSGPKSDYKFRYEAPFRALEAGIDDIGMGVLFGLDNPISEVAGLLKHIDEMKKVYGVGPHTISVPRLKFAKGAKLSYNPPYKIDDEYFCYLVSVLRIAVPYTGIILSTREPRDLRDKLINLGVSQISAGSSTSPGGYLNKDEKDEQFTVSDNRSLNEVVQSLARSGYIPSFCTACYRKGRTGEIFMELASDGRIKKFCDRNAILSFAEYVASFVDNNSELRDFLERMVLDMGDEYLNSRVFEVLNGQKDVFI
ncbi:MAG: [FeFe] hydrogenase H-cluster radical SAM maturase HydG [Proteobacteria bacterium]|nr:[FeFe] hydrogenase H-cluster radical SAM maturase HydG [Pseudomonadota bacterium]